MEGPAPYLCSSVRCLQFLVPGVFFGHEICPGVLSHPLAWPLTLWKNEGARAQNLLSSPGEVRGAQPSEF